MKKPWQPTNRKLRHRTSSRRFFACFFLLSQDQAWKLPTVHSTSSRCHGDLLPPGDLVYPVYAWGTKSQRISEGRRPWLERFFSICADQYRQLLELQTETGAKSSDRGMDRDCCAAKLGQDHDLYWSEEETTYIPQDLLEKMSTYCNTHTFRSVATICF